MEPPTHAQREQVNSTNSIQTPAVSDSQQIELRTVSMNGNVINNSKKTEAQVEEMSVRGIVPDTDTPQPQQSNKNAGNENNENKDVKTDIESQKVVNIAREDVEPYSEGIYGGMCSLLFVFVLFVIIASVASDATWQFWLDFIIKTGVVFLIAYVCGLLAQKRKLKVNYTRKIIHFSVFFIPPLFDLIFAEIDSEFLEKHGSLLPLSNVLSFSLFLALFSVRMRRLVPAFDICFYALDRPEDRPVCVCVRMCMRYSNNNGLYNDSKSLSFSLTRAHTHTHTEHNAMALRAIDAHLRCTCTISVLLFCRA